MRPWNRPQGAGTSWAIGARGKSAVKWTRLSCHDFADNQVRLQLFVLAHNLGNLSASGHVAPSGAALDADDVAGETDQHRREGGAPCAAGDLPDGGGGNPTGIVPNYSGKDRVAEIARTAARLMLAGRQMRESKMAGGDALSAFGRKLVRHATASGSHLRRSREPDLGVTKWLDSSVRGDKMLIKETEWPAMVATRRSEGKCRIKTRKEQWPCTCFED